MRSRIKFNRLIAQLAVLMLAVHNLLPLHWVWCNADGQAPRMEAAINGQCVSSSIRSDCCSMAVVAAAPDQYDAATQSVDELFDDHSCCFGCADEPAHLQNPLRIVRVLDRQPRLDAGGYLFYLAAANPLTERGAGKLHRLSVGPCAPSLAVLHTQVNQLLI